MTVETQDPLSGPMKLLANPIRLSGTPIDGYSAPPLMGQHTGDVLQRLANVSGAELERLRTEGVV